VWSFISTASYDFMAWCINTGSLWYDVGGMRFWKKFLQTSKHLETAELRAEKADGRGS